MQLNSRIRRRQFEKFDVIKLLSFHQKKFDGQNFFLISSVINGWHLLMD